MNVHQLVKVYNPHRQMRFSRERAVIDPSVWCSLNQIADQRLSALTYPCGKLHIWSKWNTLMIITQWQPQFVSGKLIMIIILIIYQSRTGDAWSKSLLIAIEETGLRWRKGRRLLFDKGTVSKSYDINYKDIIRAITNFIYIFVICAIPLSYSVVTLDKRVWLMN